MALTFAPSKYQMKSMKKSELMAVCISRNLPWEGMNREELIAALSDEPVEKLVRSKTSLGIAIEEVMVDLAFSEDTCEQLRRAQKEGLVNEKNVVGLGNSLKFPRNLDFVSDRIDRFKFESFIRKRLKSQANKVKAKKRDSPPLARGKTADQSSDSAIGSRTASESDDQSTAFSIDYQDDEMPPALEVPEFVDDEDTQEAFDDNAETEEQPASEPVEQIAAAPEGVHVRRGKLLWKFIVELLEDPNYCPSAIRWQDRDDWIFEIVRSKVVASLWGVRKGNTVMDYDKLSRALRQYYETGILNCVPGRRLTYQFGPRAIREIEAAAGRGSL